MLRPRSATAAALLAASALFAMTPATPARAADAAAKPAGESNAPAAAPDKAKAAEEGRKALDRAMAFLESQQQPNGSWQRSDREPPAVSALVLKAIARDPKRGGKSPAAKKAVDYLLSVQRDDGGIYKDMLATYNTAIAISGLAAVKDPALKERIDRAVGYLKASQWRDGIAGPDGQKIGPDHPFVGGWGYGGTQGRPDVSNAAVALEALKDAGLDANDPAYRNAVTFLSRLQNLSETNKAAWAGDDGGFIYSTGKNGEGESSAGEVTMPDGRRGLRSYGSMTYAGLKSMIYAGLTKDDPRVKGAFKWIGQNFSVDENPGMAAMGPEHAKAGIYYYYTTLARALAVYGEPTLTDRRGTSHDWRLALIAKLAAEQKPDGSFVGDRKWMENNPVIATVMAALALQDALADLEARPAK